MLLGFTMHKIRFHSSSGAAVLVWWGCLLCGGTWCRGPGMGCGLTWAEVVFGSNLGVCILHGPGGLHVALVEVVRRGVTYAGTHRPDGVRRPGGMTHRRVVKRPIWRGDRPMSDRRGGWLGWRSPAGTEKRGGVAHRRVVKRPTCRGERRLSSERGRWLHSRSFSMGIAFLTARLEYLA